MARRHRIVARAVRLYWRLRQPRSLGVRAVVRDGAGRIALVRHTYTDHWYLPGGGVKKGESCAAAISREVQEEIGLSGCVIERVIGVYHSRREHKDDHVVLFALFAPGASSLQVGDPREIEQAAWFTPDALPVGLSPATARRLEEYLAGVGGYGAW